MRTQSIYIVAVETKGYPARTSNFDFLTLREARRWAKDTARTGMLFGRRITGMGITKRVEIVMDVMPYRSI